MNTAAARAASTGTGKAAKSEVLSPGPSNRKSEHYSEFRKECSFIRRPS